VLNGFFVAAEFALLAARRSRIEQLAADGDKRAGHVLIGVALLLTSLTIISSLSTPWLTDLFASPNRGICLYD
jgi:CBS domain containing-hemolysin-like protein